MKPPTHRDHRPALLMKNNPANHPMQKINLDKTPGAARH
jgi:hypothetical protein